MELFRRHFTIVPPEMPSDGWRRLFEKTARMENNMSKGLFKANRLKGHLFGVICVAIAPRHIISGANDTHIIFWYSVEFLFSYSQEQADW